MSYAYIESKPSKKVIAKAVSSISGVPLEEIDVRDLGDFEDLDTKKLLVVRSSLGAEPFCYSVRVGNKFRGIRLPSGEFMASAEFGPKLAEALGERVLFDDDLDEGDSDYLPILVADPNGTIHKAEYREGRIVILD